MAEIPSGERLSDGIPTTNHEKSMNTKKQKSKPKNAPQQKTGGGCPSATCSPSWKVGDWAFFEHKLAMVKRVDADGRVTEMSTGHFSTSSMDLRDRMFPMDLRGKCVSEEYQCQYDKLHKESRGLNLNFPDFHRWFVDKWAECMERRHDDEVVKAAYEELNQFVRGILDAASDQRGRSVMGVGLFR